MLLLLLSACLGRLSLDGEKDLVRAALLLESETDERWLIVANSTLLCEPEVTENDPRTTIDEAASAKEFWQAQIVAAQTREGAFVTVARLSGDAGDFALGPWIDGGPAGAWYHVIEASVTEREELLTTYVAEESEENFEASGTVSLTPDGDHYQGSFDYPEDEVSGTFRAEGCESDELLRAATETQY